MTRMIQVRNVPDELHLELLKRAHKHSQTLTAYIQDILFREIQRPPAIEVFERIEKRSRVHLDHPAADLLHEERSGRDDP